MRHQGFASDGRGEVLEDRGRGGEPLRSVRAAEQLVDQAERRLRADQLHESLQALRLGER